MSIGSEIEEMSFQVETESKERPYRLEVKSKRSHVN